MLCEIAERNGILAIRCQTVSGELIGRLAGLLNVSSSSSGAGSSTGPADCPFIKYSIQLPGLIVAKEYVAKEYVDPEKRPIESWMIGIAAKWGNSSRRKCITNEIHRSSEDCSSMEAEVLE